MSIFSLASVNAAAQLESSISMQQALTKSLLQHPELPGYQQLLNSADGYITQAGIGERAQLNLAIEDAFGTGRYGGIKNSQSTLSISWLMDDELLDKRSIAARTQKNSFQTKQDIKRLDIAAETARYYLTALFFQEKKQLQLDAIQQVKLVKNEVNKRVNLGAAPKADLFRAQAALAKRKMKINDIDYEIRSSIKNLAAQWAEVTPSFIAVLGNMNTPIPNIDSSELKDKLDSNPNIILLLNEERLARSKIDLAKAEEKIQWRFNSGIRRYEASNDFGLIAGISIPLGRSNSNKGKIRALTAEQFASRSNVKALRIQLVTQLDSFIRSLERYQASIKSLNNKVIPKISQALNEAKKAYVLGKYSFEELTSAHNELLESKATLLDLQYKAHLNRVEIEHLVGTPLENSVKEKI